MSKRLIDANELISAMYYYEHNEGGLTAYDAQDIINKAPSIDIVRCKECKHWIGHIADDDGFDGEDECRWRDSEAPNADDYCSYGEREDE